ncbi:MAG: alpha/beta hydrolase [Chloroflexota bacterium]
MKADQQIVWKKFWARVVGRAFLISVLAVFIAVGVSMYRVTEDYLHPPRVIATGDALRANGIDFTTVSLATEDGITLHAFYTPPKNGALILAAHGHAGTIDEKTYALFARHGYGVLAWNFRAHGESGGDFTSLGYYEVLDVKAALDFALAQPGVEHIGIWGGSMGAATAILAAARYPQIEAVVADSAYDSLEGVLQVRIPAPILQPFVRFFAEVETGLRVDAVRPVDEVGKISPRPVFIIQGLEDHAIPSASAQNLFAAAGEPKFLWEGEGAGHVKMFNVFPEEYEARVIGFFEEALLGR